MEIKTTRREKEGTSKKKVEGSLEDQKRISKKKPENEKKEIGHRYNNRVAEFANSNKVKENQRIKIQGRKEEFSIRRLNELREIKPNTNPYFPNKENMY